MAGRVPSFFLLVPGPWSNDEELVAQLRSAAIDSTPPSQSPIEAGQIRVEIVQDPGGFGGAFAWGSRGPMPDEVVAQAAGTTNAALVEVAGYLHEQLEPTLALGRALAAGKGAAVRMEASGGASEWSNWTDDLGSGFAGSLFRAACLVISDGEGGFFSCGMHHFGLPDAHVEGLSPQDAARWLELLGGYQIENGPVIHTGHTFGGDEHGGKRRVVRWPDHRHDPYDGRHNPFGVWRSTPAAESGLEALSPEPVLIPALVAILTAAERRNERPLTRSEVEQLVENSSAIAMEPADARALERSRGYADLEPRLAWDQWQLVRPS